jgi:hypothetical protein
VTTLDFFRELRPLSPRFFLGSCQNMVCAGSDRGLPTVDLGATWENLRRYGRSDGMIDLDSDLTIRQDSASVPLGRTGIYLFYFFRVST